MRVRFLIDSSLPMSLESEAPAGVELKRWTGQYLPDDQFAKVAAERRYEGIVVLGRNSLHQRNLRDQCADLGLSLIAVEAGDPIEAKDRVLRNMAKIRSALGESQAVIVYARTVRPA